MRADTQCLQVDGAWRVTARVGLDREEESRLFLLGDILLSWPTDGLIVPVSGPRLARGCMYISEINSKPGGLALDFGSELQARQVLEVIAEQLRRASERLAGRSRTSTPPPPEALDAAGWTDQVGDDSMQDLIAEYTEMPGVVAALLISNQGLVVAAVEKESVEPETIAALVVDTLAAARRFGSAADIGELDTLSMEFERAGIFLAPFEDDVILALVKRPHPTGVTDTRTSSPQ